ncbi:MAG: methionine synthase [Bacteroidales bacterium]|nr:methionine synthase [Candidatus Liminaster caballi]
MNNRIKTKISDVAKQRLLVLDGGIGTMIQRENLTEEDFRGSLFAGHQILLRGNNDVLSLTRPDVIEQEIRSYLDAGADIVTTNTFSSQRISQREYGLEESVADMNRASVTIARRLADQYTAQNPDKPRFVAGSVGPTSKMLSMSEDVNNPAARSITFDELESAYYEQICVMVESGVDVILVETIFDTLNAKAAISAYQKVCDDVQAASDVSLMLSMTVSDASGRTLSGQTVEAFVASVMHANPLSVGMNCGLGADGILPWLSRMSDFATCMVSCHPNAGLPNQFGGYDQSPEEFVRLMQPFFDRHLVNIVGGCCGTTPDHIRALSAAVDSLNANGYQVRQSVVPAERHTILSGLEPLEAGASDFIRVGERCNVAGSRKFLRLINEKKYDEALEIARRQVEDGAMVIDVNMDDGLLDAKSEMRTFLNLLASDPAICRVPVMVDSSRFDVIEEGLKCMQGKGVVNSISLKMGEEEFVAHARTVHRLGAAVIVMCFDEEGQATDYSRRVDICRRAFDLLTSKVGFSPEDIIFDPNVLTIATGMAEHNDYAADFIRATRWVKDNLPGTRVSGGLSNLSFAFRGNNYLREAMHSCFLHLAMPQGMNMAILNPATALDYKSIPAELRLAINEVILNTSPDAADLLQEMAQALLEGKTTATATSPSPTVRSVASTQSASAAEKTVPSTPEEVLRQCLLKGQTNGLEENLLTLINRGDSPVSIIAGPLMDGMNEVGTLFGQGKMFLPQVVKTARTMKRAVEVLQPYIEAANATQDVASTKNGKILIATVKGDVHDIGKNIVGVVLACNNFEVIDLGVMVPVEKIIDTAIAENVDIVCLSGLITPSLDEMCAVARAMQQAGLRIPLFVGGATTSVRHTALKIMPCYDGPVFHLRDAAQNPVLALKLLDPAQRDEVIADNRRQLEALLKPREDIVTVRSLIPLIDWNYFFWAWRTKADTEVGASLRADAERLLEEIASNDADIYAPRFAQKFYPAVGNKSEHSITVTLRHNDHEPNCPCCNQTVVLPTPICGHHALCDWLATDSERDSAIASGTPLPDYMTNVGVFAVTMSEAFTHRLEHLKDERGGGDYDVLLLQTLGDRLAEATAEFLSRRLSSERGWKGIRPAVGYPSWPDQKNIFLLARLVDFQKLGITLTENGAMYPQASVCGLYLGNPEAEY